MSDQLRRFYDALIGNPGLLQSDKVQSEMQWMIGHEWCTWITDSRKSFRG
jgi:hypothetical protein